MPAFFFRKPHTTSL